MFRKVLIANRGEIAVRVIRACRDLDINSVAVYSDADQKSAHVILADEAVNIGPAIASQSYLNIERILEAAKDTGAEAIHPGYGFLSENYNFAKACAKAGIILIGPPPKAMEAMGDKVSAREIMRKAGVPIVPGSKALADVAQAQKAAKEVGFPLMLKASAGGGGIGMRIVDAEAKLASNFEAAQDAARRSFGNDTIFMERYVKEPRHIEIQVLADQHGNTIYLGERECSIQRRHQKVIEEAPSPIIDENSRKKMGDAAVKAAKAVGYVNAGTVEFIYSQGEFFFLEMNTRLQVEHPITEEITGIDLVVQQLRVASGERLQIPQDQIVLRGWAIECRINAEDPAMDFMPSSGRVSGYREPSGPGVRVDSSLLGRGEVSPHYDSMIAKLITWGADREQAIQRMKRALLEYAITGITTNITYHLAILSDPDFVAGKLNTHFIAEHPQLIDEMSVWQEHKQKFMVGLQNNAQIAALAGALAVTAEG